jgi:5-deoxy-glucuronate isomerase
MQYDFEVKQMTIQTQEAKNQYVFRGTNKHKGRKLAISPQNSSMKHLNYGRIILDAEAPTAEFETGDREVGLICLSGECTIESAGESHELTRYDSIYIPRDSQVNVSTKTNVDLAECSAEVDNKYPLRVVRYEEVRNNSALSFDTGTDANRRRVNIALGKNIEAGRILAGFTTSEPGNWTSFPPHEHAEMLEELYVYYDMPAPAFGIQLVYTDTEEPEFVGIVRDGDAVVMPEGFHPNVSVPGHTLSFVWMMAAHREIEDRQFGVVKVQPGFDKGGTGLEASRK